ncbi:HAD family hydrolase [Gordonia sp. PKS22-38]|uniref:HAD family hydrolase n=1 Tax=Gordonia prachuapensis TaxID=3115651 RepID=A0ABU7MU07_9ACTN|nr:HAD family hydrolase [Gordonia sp. PKS22-38]
MSGPLRLPGGVRAVVFDVGETLVDESRMWSYHARRVGVTPFALMGVIGALIEAGQPHDHAWRVLGVDRPDTAPQIKSTDLYPDALDCLSAVKTAGFVVGIAGNQPAGAVAQLSDLGFEADVVASSAQWGVSKPSVGFFSRLVRAVGMPAEDILYVGDRLDNDVLPAAAVGIRTALLRRGPWGHIHSRRPEADRADLLLDSLHQLRTMLPKQLGMSAPPADSSGTSPL